MLRSNQQTFITLAAAVSIALVAVLGAPIPALRAAGKGLQIVALPSLKLRLALHQVVPTSSLQTDTTQAGFISASLTKISSDASAVQHERRQVSSGGTGPLSEVSPLQFLGGNITCHNNHAGWASDCGDGFWQDKAIWASVDLPQSAGKGKWQHCLKTCCVVAKGGNGKVPTLGEMTTWARSAYAYCDGPNLQTWRSANMDVYTIGDKGDFKMCLCNSGSVNKC